MIQQDQTVLTPTVLTPQRLCETRGGNLAHTLGRIVFRPGRPMLVEHLGGLYLEHDLRGGVVTPGYGDEYNIVHVFESGKACAAAGCSHAVAPRRRRAGRHLRSIARE
ncbi:MAG: hypothetical protein RBS08_04615 [Bdellovibrionales bacterium]|jgi:hypothetical protein|nr:hypothetical protein [Bdellovibrionales bacterium]